MIYIVAGSFRVSLVIELRGADSLGTSLWHFYDK